MPREIKTTIAVDGEAAFKRAINEANTSMKNLGTQLTLAQAKFKQDGDAMKLMETRSKALKGEIGQQEEIVKALEKAVTDTASAYGENSTQTEKWEAELNRAKAKLISLQNELTLNNQGLDRNGKAFDEGADAAADYQATLETIGKNVSFEAVTGGIGKITSTVQGAITKVFSLANTIRNAMVDSGKWADELATDAKVKGFGDDVEELQRWRYASEMVDTSVEDIIKARDKLGEKMRKGWKDGKKDMWEFLGVDIRDENGNFRDTMDMLFEMGDVLKGVAFADQNEVRANSLAMELFGKSYRELLPLFSAGRDEWEKYKSEAQVVSEAHVKALTEMDDANVQLENSWDVLKTSFWAELAPTMTEVTTALSGMLNEFNDWMKTEDGQKAMADLSEALKELFSGVKDIKFKDAIDAAREAINKLTQGLQWLADHRKELEDAFTILAVGFGGLKVTEGVLEFMRLLNGGKSLLGAGGAAASGASSGVANAASAASGVAASGGFASLLGFTSVLGGIGYGTYKGWEALGNWRKANPEKIRGQDENLAAEAAGVEDLLAKWVQANAAMEALDVDATAEEVDAIQARIDEARKELEKTEEGNKALQAYSDWFWDTEKGNGKWILPEGWTVPEEAATGQTNVDVVGEPVYKDRRPKGNPLQELQNSWEEETPGESGKALQNLSASSEGLNDAAAEMRINTEQNKQIVDKIAGVDLKTFNGLPPLMIAAVREGAAAGVSGIQVKIDGRVAGRLLAPFIGEYMAEKAYG